MLGHDEKFRHFLLRRVRPLKLDAIRKYEEKVSCCAEIMQHLEGVKSSATQERLKNVLRNINEDACQIMGECTKEYSAQQELWLARRRFALTSGNFFQLSWRAGKLYRFLCAWANYRVVQIKTFFKCLPKKPGRWIDRKQVYNNLAKL